MKKASTIFLICILILQSKFLTGQNIEQAMALYSNHELDSALILTKEILAEHPGDADANVLAGRILVESRKIPEAISYLEAAVSNPDAPLYARAWAKQYLGMCYFFKGDITKAKKFTEECMEMNATRNSASAARNAWYTMGLDTLYDSWLVLESEHFIFHIQDTLSLRDVSKFIKRKEEAFDTINSFFKARLPKKIDYFVWSDRRQAKSLLRRDLAFTYSNLCITHTEPRHTVGHEMTHTISLHSVPVVSLNALISEGVAVYFDLSDRDRLQALKKNLTDTLSIEDIWKKTVKVPEKILYPLGSLLVKSLLEKYGRDKFMQLLADQSFESAKRIYGKDLDKTLNELEEMIN